MYQANKIATCCFCGQRTILDLRGARRHELACNSCGAPLRHMKSLKADAVGTPPARTRSRPPEPRHRKPHGRKKSKGLAARVLDIAEDVFDIFD